MKRYLSALCGALMALVVCASAQSLPTTPYRLDYFNNANTTGAPDATLRLDNDGSASHGDMCADIFVFNANEEISECCGCLETPDDLLTLSVNNNLDSNPATGSPITSGLILIVAAATTNGLCPAPVHIKPLTGAEIQGWATHIQDSNYTITETASQVSSLSSSEESALARQCGAIVAVDSGFGVCNCPAGQN
jgi:hypothetical protein